MKGDIDSAEVEEYGDSFAEEFATNKGDFMSNCGSDNCLFFLGYDMEPPMFKSRFKQDAEGSRVLETKSVLSDLGFTDTRFSLTVESDINCEKETSPCMLGDKEDGVDEFDDSMPGPSLSKELPSSGSHSRSSSKIPSSIESSVNGIILRISILSYTNLKMLTTGRCFRIHS